MNSKQRTPKQQARFDAATDRAVRIAQDRHIRIWNERIAKEREEALVLAAAVMQADIEAFLS